MTKVTLSLPPEVAAKILNNPKAFMDYMKSKGFPVEDVFRNKESVYDLCPACNSSNNTKLLGNIKQCADCGGLYGRTVRETALKYVNLDQMAANARDQFYFDFTWIPNETRVHGWACADTKKVIQWG